MECVREERVRLGDGAETTVLRWGERGPLLVCIHGLGASREGWARIGEHLAGRYRVVAYDQRGHGDSTADGPMTLEQTVADLASVIASLGEPVDALVGHSWGGALAVAGGRRLDVARVVAIDPMLHVRPGVWGTNVMPEYRKNLAQPIGEREASIRSSYASLPDVEIGGKLHAARRVRLEAIAALGVDNGIDDGGWDLRSTVHGYPKPLLIALADPARSQVVPASERADLHVLGGPHVRVEVFEGASHSLQRDAFDRFIPVLERFLSIEP
jgi:pimeloyl-ACP methyl ester carboxylesterase